MLQLLGFPRGRIAIAGVFALAGLMADGQPVGADPPHGAHHHHYGGWGHAYAGPGFAHRHRVYVPAYPYAGYHRHALGYGYGLGYGCPRYYQPGFSLSFRIGDIPPPGYAYIDPYCGAQFGSLGGYLDHVAVYEHSPVIEIFDLEGGVTVGSYGYSRGR